MSIRDKEYLKRLSLRQSDLSRILRISRQAINVGIRGNNDYLNIDDMQKIYRHFVSTGDFRQKEITNILADDFEIKYPDLVGIPDIFGLELSDNQIKLIIGNRILREHLKEVISNIVETKCQEFEMVFAKK